MLGVCVGGAGSLMLMSTSLLPFLSVGLSLKMKAWVYILPKAVGEGGRQNYFFFSQEFWAE